jgi:ribonuclease HI
MEIIVQTDGGARGNPGPAGTGVVVKTVDGEVLHTAATFLGTKTNNEAEYTALLSSLTWLKTHLPADTTQITYQLDSKLVIEQIQKHWKIKEPRLQEFATECWALLKQLNCPVTFQYIPRALNAVADQLANDAMDQGTMA